MTEVTTALNLSCGARRRLQALAALAWPVDRLRDMLPGIAVDAVLNGTDTEISAAEHRQISSLYERLSMTVGPCPATRDQAAARHWPPPLGWDDELIDDPSARPARSWCPPAPGGGRSPRLADRYLDLHAQGLNQRQLIEQLTTSALSLATALRHRGLPVDPELAAMAAAQRNARYRANRQRQLAGRPAGQTGTC